VFTSGYAVNHRLSRRGGQSIFAKTNEPGTLT
jgi:hypothetical protein